jgi:hypothetical protein
VFKLGEIDDDNFGFEEWPPGGLIGLRLAGGSGACVVTSRRYI